MELFDIIGIVIIVAAALKGGRRGFVVTLGRLCAGILSLLLVYLLNTWAFAQLVPTLLVDHQVIIVRVLLCVVLYIVLFLVLKTIILSLRILTGLPIIKVFPVRNGETRTATNCALMHRLVRTLPQI